MVWKQTEGFSASIPCSLYRETQGRVSPADSEPPLVPTVKESIDHDIQEFKNFLQSRIPVHFIPLQDREILCYRFNERLEQAKNQGIQLADVEIGEDCLPTWPGWNWDPMAQSLHSVIQDRLRDIEFSQKIGLLVQREIITKSSRKLKEAEHLGLSLRDISFGDDLLPRWSKDVAQQQRWSGNETPHPLQSQDSGYFSRESSTDTSLGDDQTADNRSAINGLLQKSDHPEYEHQRDDALVRSNERTEMDQRARIAFSLRGYFSTQPCNVDADTDSDSSLDDSDNETSTALTNIAHDVEKVGGSGPQNLIDMEVYLAEDSDIDDTTPEAQLTVDLEAYEYHFGAEDAVDIELTGVTSTDTNTVEQREEDEVLTRDQELLRQMGLRHCWVRRSISKRAQVEHVESLITEHRAKIEEELLRAQQSRSDSQTGSMPSLSVQGSGHMVFDSESDISEEGVTSDDEDEEGEQEAEQPDSQETNDHESTDTVTDVVPDEKLGDSEDVLQIEW